MSGDTGSTISSGNGTEACSTPLMSKSGSRASLLKAETNRDNQICGANGLNSQLKRFKSLPAGKIRRKKRRAPSPPKDQKPLISGKSEPETQPMTVLANK